MSLDAGQLTVLRSGIRAIHPCRVAVRIRRWRSIPKSKTGLPREARCCPKPKVCPSCLDILFKLPPLRSLSPSRCSMARHRLGPLRLTVHPLSSQERRTLPVDCAPEPSGKPRRRANGGNEHGLIQVFPSDGGVVVRHRPKSQAAAQSTMRPTGQRYRGHGLPIAADWSAYH
jgi:hypothetical protein